MVPFPLESFCRAQAKLDGLESKRVKAWEAAVRALQPQSVVCGQIVKVGVLLPLG